MGRKQKISFALKNPSESLLTQKGLKSWNGDRTKEKKEMKDVMICPEPSVPRVETPVTHMARAHAANQTP